MAELVLALLPEALRIHRLPASARLAQVLKDTASASSPGNSATDQTLFATLHSRDELSIVCDANLKVTSEQSSGPWRAMYVVGQLDFALTGVMAGLAQPLAAAKISIFAISSFDTDYLLVKADALDSAVAALKSAGYSFGHAH